MSRFVVGFFGRYAVRTRWAAVWTLAFATACGTQTGTGGNAASGSGAGGANGGQTGSTAGASGQPAPGGASGSAGSSGAGSSAASASMTGASGQPTPGGASGSAGSSGGGSSAASASMTGASGAGASGAGTSTGSDADGASPAGPSGDADSSTGGGSTPDAAAKDASLPPVACQAPLAVSGTALTVAVNLATTRSTVPPSLMGIYSAVYEESFSLPTTPPALMGAGVRAIRYPGGSYADIYHWSTATTSVEVGTDGGAAYVGPGTDFGSFIGLIDSAGATGIITVNYGSNPQGTGPGVPQEAAAWVAYANGTPDNMTAIGVDAAGTDWKTVSYWATLRAAAALPVDDGLNFLRISHPTPVGIKYWEVGNELYGNGFYYGGAGWEEDLHLLHNGTPRQGNANLSPVKYGQVFPTFAQAMKAVDPTVKVGGILHWPYTEYASPATTDWNASVLTPATCAAIDFGIDHWYAGSSLTDLLTRPRVDIPAMFTALQAKVATLCPSKAGSLPLAITEWGPNLLNFTLTPPAETQLTGLFAADAYANFMEQGAINVDWLELHSGGTYLTDTDVPTWGYHGQQMASYLANGGDTMVQATVQATPPAAFAAGLFQAHASKHADGSIGIMLVNTSPTTAAAATVTVTGLAAGTKLPCVGTEYLYTPQGTDAEDGTVTSTPIFSTNDANNRVAVAVPAYSVVALTFP
jgi:alpha-L-arabinofuranosidase